MEENGFDDNLFHTPPAQKTYNAKLVFDARNHGRCLDCERQEHLSRLESSRPSHGNELDAMYDAVIWILENTDYPVGE